jgi:hypothetical protein
MRLTERYRCDLGRKIQTRLTLTDQMRLTMTEQLRLTLTEQMRLTLTEQMRLTLTEQMRLTLMTPSRLTRRKNVFTRASGGDENRPLGDIGHSIAHLVTPR